MSAGEIHVLDTHALLVHVNWSTFNKSSDINTYSRVLHFHL